MLQKDNNKIHSNAMNRFDSIITVIKYSNKIIEKRLADHSKAKKSNRRNVSCFCIKPIRAK